MKKLKKSIQVYWNQELKDVNVCDNSIIINDESHTAQSKVNIPYKGTKNTGLLLASMVISRNLEIETSVSYL